MWQENIVTCAFVMCIFQMSTFSRHLDLNWIVKYFYVYLCVVRVCVWMCILFKDFFYIFYINIFSFLFFFPTNLRF